MTKDELESWCRSRGYADAANRELQIKIARAVLSKTAWGYFRAVAAKKPWIRRMAGDVQSAVDEILMHAEGRFDPRRDNGMGGKIQLCAFVKPIFLLLFARKMRKLAGFGMRLAGDNYTDKDMFDRGRKRSRILFGSELFFSDGKANPLWIPSVSSELKGWTEDEWREFLRCLPQRSRGMVELYYRQGMTLEEISQLIGITRERVRQVLNDAKHRLIGPAIRRIGEIIPLKQ